MPALAAGLAESEAVNRFLRPHDTALAAAGSARYNAADTTPARTPVVVQASAKI